MEAKQKFSTAQYILGIDVLTNLNKFLLWIVSNLMMFS